MINRYVNICFSSHCVSQVRNSYGERHFSDFYIALWWCIIIIIIILSKYMVILLSFLSGRLFRVRQSRLDMKKPSITRRRKNPGQAKTILSLSGIAERIYRAGGRVRENIIKGKTERSSVTVLSSFPERTHAGGNDRRQPRRKPKRTRTHTWYDVLSIYINWWHANSSERKTPLPHGRHRRVLKLPYYYYYHYYYHRLLPPLILLRTGPARRQ